MRQVAVLMVFLMFVVTIPATAQVPNPTRLEAPVLSDVPDLLPVPRPKEKILPTKELEKLEPLELTVIPYPIDPHLQGSPPKVLTLPTVIASVDRHYPLLVATLQERGIAGGKLLSAEGNFDFTFNGFDYVNQGSFDSHRFNLGFAQPLVLQGIDVRGGYRMGAGIYPSYYGDRQTAEGGAFRLGMTLPLLKNREIDSRRAAVQKGILERSLAEPTIIEKRLLFYQQASRTYWNWVAAAQRYRIALQLLQIAEKREEFLLKRLKEGIESQFEVVDNRRLIVDRRTRLVMFQRGYELASIDLSLFLRDEKGHPQRPEAAWRAPDFPEPIQPDASKLPQDVELAWSQRPELKGLQLQRQQLNVDLRLAENQTLPSLNVVLYGEQDVGNEKATLNRAEYEAGLLLNVPLQRREAKGKILTVQAKLARLTFREQFTRDRIAAEVQNVVSALVRAYETRKQAKKNVELNQALVNAERKKFVLGNSNILFVNIRELALAEAQLQEIAAFLEYYQSLADYYAVLGIGGNREE